MPDDREREPYNLLDPPLDEYTPRSPVAGEVDFEAPCLKCGYNLRGLDRMAACPECGTPVVRSLMGDLLQFSSPDYVATLRRGATLIALTDIASVVAIALGILIAVTAPSAGQLPSLILQTGIAASLLLGWWWLAAVDPAQEGRDEAVQSRRVLRVVVGVRLGVVIAQFLLALTGPLALGALAPTSAGGPSLRFLAPQAIAQIALSLASLAAVITMWIAGMLYVRSLCRRLPDLGLERFAKVMVWLGPVLNTVGWLVLCMGPLAALVCEVVIMLRLRTALGGVQRRMAQPLGWSTVVASIDQRR